MQKNPCIASYLKTETNNVSCMNSYVIDKWEKPCPLAQMAGLGKQPVANGQFHSM